MPKAILLSSAPSTITDDTETHYVVANGTNTSASHNMILSPNPNYETIDPNKKSICFTVKKEGSDCFKIENDEKRCFSITTDTEDKPTPDAGNPIDISDYVDEIYGIHFSSVDRLFVLGNFEGTYDSIYIFEFSYFAGSTGGIKDIENLTKKIFIEKGSNLNYTFLTGWGTVLTYNLFFRLGNTLYLIDPDSENVVTEEFVIDVTFGYNFFSPDDVRLVHGTADVDEYYWDTGSDTQCVFDNVYNTDILKLQVYRKEADELNLVNADYPYWGKFNSAVQAIFEDSFGKKIVVTLSEYTPQEKAKIYVFYDAHVSSIYEPIRDVSPENDEGRRLDVCSYCYSSSTYLEYECESAVSAIKFCQYDGRFLDVGYTIMSGEATNFVHLYIDISNFVMWKKQDNDIVIRNKKNIAHDTTLAGGFVLSIDSEVGKLKQEPIIDIIDAYP